MDGDITKIGAATVTLVAAPKQEDLIDALKNRILRDMELLGIEVLKSNRKDKFHVVSRLGKQAMNFQRLISTSVKDFQKNPGFPREEIDQDDIQDELLGGEYGHIGNMYENPQVGLFRQLMDTMGPFLNNKNKTMELDVRSARLQELKELKSFSLTLTPDDPSRAKIVEHIEQLTKEIANDLVPPELLRRHQTEPVAQQEIAPGMGASIAAGENGDAGLREES